MENGNSKRSRNLKMPQIPLKRGAFKLLGYTTVDEVDYTYLNQFSWTLDSRGYASTRIDKKTYRMHYLLGGKWQDHKDRNKLNNTRGNIRPCTPQQNSFNRSRRATTKAKWKGVARVGSRWKATIRVNGLHCHLGVFNCPTRAAIAYDKTALKIGGEFAACNILNITA